jgi:alpha-1,2-mannosyltransferase
MTRPDTDRLVRAALPVLALLSIFVGTGATLAVAGDTLGYDFLAYHQAAERVLAGQPLYDMSFEASGGFGLFYYPPPFLPFILPFGLLDTATAPWVWIGVLALAFGIGVAVLPVSRSIRWWVVLLAGLSWPFVYAMKLGQVGPLLFLAFAIGWRWIDDPVRLGASAAAGAAIKLQPGILFVWALLLRRWSAVLVGIVVLLVLSVVATALAGVSAWTDFITLVRTVSDPIATENNVTPGAVAYQAGVPAGPATVIQLASMVLVVVLLVLSTRWLTTEASFMVAVIASQLLSPILWDHYAMLLLLPVAYLLAAGRRWSVAIPLATSLPLVGVVPAVVYPIAFFVTLVAVIATGRRPSVASAR